MDGWKLEKLIKIFKILLYSLMCQFEYSQAHLHCGAHVEVDSLFPPWDLGMELRSLGHTTTPVCRPISPVIQFSVR